MEGTSASHIFGRFSLIGSKVRRRPRARSAEFWGALKSAGLALALASLAILSQPRPAAASCAQANGDPKCWSEFDSFSAVAWVGDGYVAVGHLRGQSATAWAMIHISSDGRASEKVEIPAWRKASDDVVAVEFHKIVVLPKGDLALVGSFHPANLNELAGLVLAVDANGRVKWSGERVDQSANVMFQSAVYDATAKVVIAVGRRTSGGDDGTCRNWSQSYVQGFDASTGAIADPLIVTGEQVAGPNNRQGYYDVTPTDRPRQYAIVGFKTEPDATEGRCRDRIRLGFVSPGSAAGGQAAKWSMSGGDIADGVQESEDGYAIRSVGPGEYVIAGQIGDLANGKSLAHAIRVNMNPFAIQGSLDAPPGDPNAAHGAARFRVATPIRDGAHVLLAGSKTATGPAAGSAAISQVASTDLAKSEPLSAQEGDGADILSAATSPKGQVLMAGFAMDDKGQRVGWLQFLGGGELRHPNAEAPATQHVASDRSLPPLLKALTRVGSAYRLPDNALSGASRYYLSQVPSGLPVDIAFSTAAPVVIHVRLLIGGGDMDLALQDGDGHLVDFSNYQSGLPQVILVKLAPGNYTLSLIADTDSKDIELDLGRSNEIDVAAIAKIGNGLSEDERAKLSDRLYQDGFSRPSEPSIAFGAETLLSLIAARDRGTNLPAKVVEKLPRDLIFGGR